jgi:diguanylate cyclase (GGDEF)-like protein
MSSSRARVKTGAGAPDGTGVGAPPDVARELRRMVRLNRSTFPVGTAACALTLYALARPYVPEGRLLGWTAAGLASAVLFAVALWPPFERRSDADGLPVLLPAAGYFCGVVFGVLPWLDLHALRTTPFAWVSLVILLAMSSGSQSGLINGTPHLARVMVPAWVLAAAAFAVVGTWVVVVAAATFLAIVVRDAVTSRRFVIAGVEARVNAAIQARTDHLTGLANRAGALGELDRLARLRRPGRAEVLVLYVDLDWFKEVNDTHGHLAGDALLVEVARRLLLCVRPEDHVARLGGDEFLCVLVVADDAPVDVGAICTRVLASVGAPFDLDGPQVGVSASIGVAGARAGDFATDDLLRRADAALYAAKRAGRGRAVREDGVTHPG